MTNDTATPTCGPWEARNSIIPGDIAIIADGLIIAEVFLRVARQTHAPVDANARLIAAAPDMLEALEGLTNYVQQELIPSVRVVSAGQTLLDKGWGLVSKAHAVIKAATS